LGVPVVVRWGRQLGLALVVSIDEDHDEPELLQPGTGFPVLRRYFSTSSEAGLADLPDGCWTWRPTGPTDDLDGQVDSAATERPAADIHGPLAVTPADAPRGEILAALADAEASDPSDVAAGIRAIHADAARAPVGHAAYRRPHDRGDSERAAVVSFLRGVGCFDLAARIDRGDQWRGIVASRPGDRATDADRLREITWRYYEIRDAVLAWLEQPDPDTWTTMVGLGICFRTAMRGWTSEGFRRLDNSLPLPLGSHGVTITEIHADPPVAILALAPGAVLGAETFSEHDELITLLTGGALVRDEQRDLVISFLPGEPKGPAGPTRQARIPAGVHHAIRAGAEGALLLVTIVAATSRQQAAD
jgi:hypothetical protein